MWNVERICFQYLMFVFTKDVFYKEISLINIIARYIIPMYVQVHCKYLVLFSSI